MHIGSKGGDDDPLVTVAELTVKAFRHHGFAGGIAAAFHIGGISQQSQNTLVAQFAQPGQVDHAVSRGGVDLEVAGKDHSAYRGLDGKGHSICDGMVHMDKFHRKATGFHSVAGFVGDELDLVGKAVLL